MQFVIANDQFAKIIDLFSRVAAELDNPYWQQVLNTFIGAFFGAVLAFVFERHREDAKIKRDKIVDLTIFFRINVMALAALFELKDFYLLPHHDLIEEMLEFTNGALEKEPNFDYSLMQSHFESYLWPKALEAVNSPYGGVGVLQERWEVSDFPQNDVKTIAFVSNNFGSIISIYLRLHSTQAAIEREIQIRESVWLEQKKISGGFRGHMLIIKRLLLSRRDLLDLTNRAIVLSLACAALIEQCLLNDFKSDVLKKAAMHVLNPQIIPAIEPYGRMLGESENVKITNAYLKKFLKPAPSDDALKDAIT